MGLSLQQAIAAHNARVDRQQGGAGAGSRTSSSASDIRREKLTNITQMRKQAEFLSSPPGPKPYYGSKP